MNTIVQFRLRQEGGDLRWKNSKVYEPHETPEYPDIAESVSAPESVECKVTEITELISREVGNEVTTITVILRRAAK
jgi:hypothetical protein